MMKSKLLAMLLIWMGVMLVGVFGLPAQAAEVVPDWPVTDGQINATATDGTHLYVGGYFSMIGKPNGHGRAFDTSDGIADLSLPFVNKRIEVVIPDGSGGWFIGGAFSSVGGVTRKGIAHIQADGSLGDFDPDISGTVYSLLLDGTTLYAGGTFTRVNSSSINRKYLASFDINQATDNVKDFNPGLNGYVYALTKYGTTLYVGGQFTQVNTNAGEYPGVSYIAKKRNYIAAFDTTQAFDNATAFNPSLDNKVYSLQINTTGTTLYAGGTFTKVNLATTPVTRSLVASFNTNDGSSTVFDPNVIGNMVNTLLLEGSTLYAGGYFQTVNDGVSRTNLVAFNSTTGIETGYNPSPNTTVHSMALDGTTLYVGGHFTTVNTTSNIKVRRYLAAFTTTKNTQNVINNFVPKINQTVQAVAVQGGKVYAGGDFTLVDGLDRNNMAAIHLETGEVTGFNPSPDGLVASLAWGNDMLYAGGGFLNVNTVPGNQPAARQYLASFDTTVMENNVTGFKPGVDSNVNSLLLDGVTLYAGGFFTHVDSDLSNTPRNNLAAFDTTLETGAMTAFDPSLNGSVTSLQKVGNILYAGGYFSQVNTNAALYPGETITVKDRSYIAAFDTQHAINNATEFNPSLNSNVQSMVVSEGILYAGGFFTEVNTQLGGTLQSRKYLAAFYTTVMEDNATLFDTQLNNYVMALALRGTTLYASGAFSKVNTNQARQDFAAFDVTRVTDNVTSLIIRHNSPAKSLRLIGERLFTGGTYAYIEGEHHHSLGAIQFTPPTVSVDVPSGSYNTAQNVVLECVPSTGLNCKTYYSTDTSAPLRSFDEYDMPVSVSVDTTLRFYSKDDEGTISEIYSTEYRFDKVSPIVSITPTAGTYKFTQAVSITCMDDNSGCADILYTTDGSDPKISGTIYTDPIVVESNMTFKFFASDNAGNNSEVITQDYVIDSVAPVVSATPAGGSYDSTQTVTLTCSDENSGCISIIYTIDGSDPKTSGLTYTDPITIDSTKTLKFFASDNAGNESVVMTEIYTITIGSNTNSTAAGGGSSGGCSLRSGAPFDPTFGLIMLVYLFYWWRTRRY
ncbi:MAG: chitobiase/beta-hexosaminidase C-terminal domain-containing protein [Gammaproteobacteria bacterium]|nr:chitobiase/beta-hexosaminidase C-terminal domain-containing protein [Gammaproteobacteria bacterium]